MYHSSFDGDIFKYETRNLFGILYGAIGLKKRIEIPLNIVLKCRKKTFWFGVTTLEFHIERVKCGIDYPSPAQVKRILFIGCKNGLVESLQTVINKNIQLSLQGRNMGLLHLNLESVKAFYAEENSSVQTQKRAQTDHRPMDFQRYSLGQSVSGS